MVPCDLKKLILTYHVPKCMIDYGFMKVYWVYDRDKLYHSLKNGCSFPGLRSGALFKMG